MISFTPGVAAAKGTTPYIQLTQANGESLDMWRYKERRNLVLYLAHSATCPECLRFLEGLANRYHDFQDWETEIISLIPGSREDVRNISCDLNLPFPVIADPDKESAAKLGLAGTDTSHRSQAGLMVTDRWGEVYECFRAGAGHELPGVADILVTVEFIEIQCPECGVGG